MSIQAFINNNNTRDDGLETAPAALDPRDKPPRRRRIACPDADWYSFAAAAHGQQRNARAAVRCFAAPRPPGRRAALGKCRAAVFEPRHRCASDAGNPPMEPPRVLAAIERQCAVAAHGFPSPACWFAASASLPYVYLGLLIWVLGKHVISADARSGGPRSAGRSASGRW